MSRGRLGWCGTHGLVDLVTQPPLRVQAATRRAASTGRGPPLAALRPHRPGPLRGAQRPRF
eukprot:12618432-Alexandrium_andersonii.AAC.1